jgi:predicted transcriptional regulator
VRTSQFQGTKKQMEILKLIVEGTEDGAIDMDQLRERLSYKPTRQAVNCSVKFLEEYGLVIRAKQLRRGRKHVIFNPTIRGLKEYETRAGT